MKKIVTLLLVVGLISCSTEADRTTIQLDESNAMVVGDIKLIPVLYDKVDESLEILKTQYLDQSGKTVISFDHETSEETEIRYSVNNGKLHSAKSKELELDFLEGNNVLVAFPALKNGLRVIADTGVFIRNFYMGEENSGLSSSVPHLFHHFSETVDSANFILNVYLNNVPKRRGCQVRLIIDGYKFLFSPEESFKVVGLSKESHNVRIQLVDQNQKLIPGPFNDSGVMSILVN